jgi:hypothetical protein
MSVLRRLAIKMIKKYTVPSRTKMCNVLRLVRSCKGFANGDTHGAIPAEEISSFERYSVKKNTMEFVTSGATHNEANKHVEEFILISLK